MIKTLTFCDFCDEFERAGRANNFSYEGKRRIFDFFEEMDEGWELDVVAICCGFVEYDSLDDVRDAYTDLAGMDDDEVLAWLNEHTLVMPTENGVVIQEITYG